MDTVSGPLHKRKQNSRAQSMKRRSVGRRPSPRTGDAPLSWSPRRSGTPHLAPRGRRGLLRGLAVAGSGLKVRRVRSAATNEPVSFLLDTNVVSEWTRPTPNQGVISWLSQAEEDAVY